MKPCTFAPGKHKWVWEKDVTLTSPGKRPGFLRLSRKGIYTCLCGEKKYGPPRSGL